MKSVTWSNRLMSKIILLVTIALFLSRNALAIQMIIDANITDNTPGGVSESFHYNGDVNFTLLSETMDTEKWRFNVSLQESDDPVVVVICLAIIILILTAEEAQSIGTLAEKTHDQYQGAFDIDNSLLDLSGNFSRQPLIINASFDATLEAGLELVNGPYGWNAYTVQTGIGTAQTNTTIFGSKDFNAVTSLSFDSGVVLADHEKSVGTVNQCERTGGDIVICGGEFDVSISEPSTSLSLLAGIMLLSGFHLRRRRT